VFVRECCECLSGNGVSFRFWATTATFSRSLPCTCRGSDGVGSGRKCCERVAEDVVGVQLLYTTTVRLLPLLPLNIGFVEKKKV
jgi:hypothetical protein